MALKDDVLIIASQLTPLGDPLLDKVCDRVLEKLDPTLFGTDLAEAQENYAAHVLTLYQRAIAAQGSGAAIASMGSSRQSISYVNPTTTAGRANLSSTAYGMMVLSLMDDNIAAVMVVTL